MPSPTSPAGVILPGRRRPALLAIAGTEIAAVATDGRQKGESSLSPVQLDGKVASVTSGVQGHAGRERIRGGKSFDETLQSQLLGQSGVRLSAHAQKRLAERNVQLTADETARLGDAVERIQQKGADMSLVLMDDLALVVSARNRVVITALDAASAREGVFTGIDSAVIV